MNKREVIYVVTYLDDRNQKHLITVKGFSAVRFLEERYGRVFYEVTENYVHIEQRDWFPFAPSSKGKDMTFSVLR